MKILFACLFTFFGVSRFACFAWQPALDTTRRPLISVEKTVLKPMKLLVIPETVFQEDEIGPIMNNDYDELFACIKKNSLQPGKVIAFYYAGDMPFTLDVAVEVNELPGILTGRIKALEIESGDAVVVHYQGPYVQLGVAYAELDRWLMANKRKAVQAPFEAYLNYPGAIKDQWELRTDLYQRIK